MQDSLRIAIIGEFDSASPSHRATNDALMHAAEHLSLGMDYSWLPSTELADDKVAGTLRRFHGVWAAPGGPFPSTDGVVSAIRWAREHDWPYFAT
jgi:CTP synthase (UTP-ammonia lyase)